MLEIAPEYPVLFVLLFYAQPAVPHTCLTHAVAAVCHVGAWGSLMQGLDLPSLVCDILVWTLKWTFKDRFDPKIGDK